MAIALACALAVDRGFVRGLAGTILCVATQQLVFITAAFQIQQSMMAHNTHRGYLAQLIIICLFALYFALTVPSLFEQIAAGKVVPNDGANLIFAIPVIIVVLVGFIRLRYRRV